MIYDTIFVFFARLCFAQIIFNNSVPTSQSTHCDRCMFREPYKSPKYTLCVVRGGGGRVGGKGRYFNVKRVVHIVTTVL